MEIRRATVADLATVVDHRVAFVAEVRGLAADQVDAAFVEATAAFVRQGFADGSLPTWLAVDGDELLGLVSLQLQRVPPRPGELRPHDGYVLNMYVLPGARSRGVGRRLLDACLASADELGVRRFHLVATDDGRPLYESAGFAVNPTVLERAVAPPT
ncbi:MAG: GNAT family N-acetyltransferase [Acidimicrobiales bacterium]